MGAAAAAGLGSDRRGVPATRAPSRPMVDGMKQAREIIVTQ